MCRPHRARRTPAGALIVALAWSATHFIAAGGEAAEPGAADAGVPTELPGGMVMHTVQVHDVVLAPTAQLAVIDVSSPYQRPADLPTDAVWMPAPHRALPGAIWLPEAGDDDFAEPAAARFRAGLAHATNGNLQARVIVYCHEHCKRSFIAAQRAIALGYRDVVWFPEGVEGWMQAGYPTTALSANDPTPRPARKKLVVLDLELSGDLGGPEFEAEHAARLMRESARLRTDLIASQRYDVLDNAPAQSLIDRLRSEQAHLFECNGCDLDVGKVLHADLVLVAWVNRVSGLILTLTYELHDVVTSQIVARKSYDFRGDNDSAWNHAVDYMVRDMARDNAPAANP